MDNAIRRLLAPRIEKHCLLLLKDGYFKHAALEAMILVERALKDKGQIEGRQFGVNLIGNLFDGKHGVRLPVPLGEDLHQKTERYFKGVYAYYRNYAAHDGSQIDEKIATRILIIASELLELIDASELTLEESGGIEGLVRVGRFKSEETLRKLLTLLEGHHMPEGTYDGLFEEIAKNGLDESMLEPALKLGLVEMHSAQLEQPVDPSWHGEMIEWFELTDLGRSALGAIAAKAT